MHKSYQFASVSKWEILYKIVILFLTFAILDNNIV